MAEQPATVLARLDQPGRTELVARLDELVEQATLAQTEADLNAIADAVHRLVEDMPALSALLRQKGTIPTVDYSVHTFPESPHVNRQTTQIHERLNRLRARTRASSPSSAVEEYDLSQIYRMSRQRGTSTKERSPFRDMPGTATSVHNHSGNFVRIGRTFSF